jgi:hypothetical protein
MSEVKTPEQARMYINSLLQDVDTIKEGLIKPQQSLLLFAFQFGTVYSDIINNLVSLQEYFTDQINLNRDSNVASSRDSKTPLIETK